MNIFNNFKNIKGFIQIPSKIFSKFKILRQSLKNNFWCKPVKLEKLMIFHEKRMYLKMTQMLANDAKS